MTDNHTSDTKMMIKIEDEIENTNIEKNLSKNKNDRPLIHYCFYNVMCPPYEAQDRIYEHIDELNKAFVECLDIFDRIDKEEQNAGKNVKIDAERFQTRLDCVQLNDIDSVHSKINTGGFLQTVMCMYLHKNINRCIECRGNKFKKRVSNDDIICRFEAFRLLQFTETGDLTVAGYPMVSEDVTDMAFWLRAENGPLNISTVDLNISVKILTNIGSLFCQFYTAEQKLLHQVQSDAPQNQRTVWKKIVSGIREMCDVCKTSLFNYHWFCGECGFTICIDCFAIDDSSGTHNNKCTNKKWLNCSNRKKHEADKLIKAQIIAGDCFYKLLCDMHKMCRKYYVSCNYGCFTNEPNAGLNSPHDSENSANSTDKNGLENTNNNCFNSEQQKDVERKVTPSGSADEFNCENVNTIPHLLKNDRWDAPHAWLCDRQLLRLLDPKCEANCIIFEDHWSFGNPVIISKVGLNLNHSLWHPESFSNDFKNLNVDFINCVTGKVISNRPMSKFWDGFDDVDKRMCNSRNEPMFLKLKDWPSSMDFADMLPDRFKDLMDCLPLKEYTHRDGRFNLISHLPECYVRPDLGPKMYTAYGFAGDKHEYIGTTNLHLDMTDAVNVMVYVAITKNYKDLDYDWHKKRVVELIEEAGCDHLTMKRIHEDGETPGALWHVYHPTEADYIRDMLSKVATERKLRVEPFSDPIHDQKYYLDDDLRRRLHNEYGIQGCTFVQFNGDAVFIPAGAPHQVRNLHNCIKVAEDFVSPENIRYSYKMTQEFRNLSDNHSNHEDKLQVKNIVYHSIKDLVSVLFKS